jgi:hypothetical protein
VPGDDVSEVAASRSACPLVGPPEAVATNDAVHRGPYLCEVDVAKVDFNTALCGHRASDQGERKHDAGEDDGAAGLLGEVDAFAESGVLLERRC